MASQNPARAAAFSPATLPSLDVEGDVVGPRGRAGVEAPGPGERGGVEAQDVGVEVVAVGFFEWTTKRKA